MAALKNNKGAAKDKAAADKTAKIIEIAEKTMTGDLMKLVLEQAKALPKSWQQLSEAEQRDYLNRSETQIKTAVKRAIEIVASQDMITIDAVVEKVVFKDGVQAVMNLTPGSKGRHQLADSAGRIIKLVISETDHLTEGGGKPKAEKQQKSLIPEEDTSVADAKDGARGASKNVKS